MSGENDSHDNTLPWVLNKVLHVSDRILESDRSANLLIITLVILAGIAMVGIGTLAVRGAAPGAVIQEIRN